MQGDADLRRQVAAHLRVARAVEANADNVFITAGTSDGLALAIHAAGLERSTIGVENPGYPGARRVLRRLGCALEPLRVDADGLVTRALPEPNASHLKAVLVTPSHQYPLGGRLPIDRRLGLLEWARGSNALVIEDDYDSEFRFDVAPLPALVGLDGERCVVHLGTFSKVLTPWLKVGYLLAPSRMRRTLLEVRGDLGTPISGMTQRALASYMAAGGLRRHIARTRRDYAHRRQHLSRLVEVHPALNLAGVDAGLHAVVGLPVGADMEAAVGRCREAGYLVAGLDEYSVEGTVEAGRSAVVVGFGAATLTDLEVIVTCLASARKVRQSTHCIA